MGKDLIEGLVLCTPLKIIDHDKGDILHGLKAIDRGFNGFGEVYFSKIKKGQTKGWKLHTKMVMNLVVPIGEIELLFQQSETDDVQSIVLGNTNYQRVTVMPNIWMAFRGVGNGENVLMNFSNIAHDPNESVNRPI